MFFLKRVYFNKINIIKGLITALLFSTPIYLAYFGFEIKIINTICLLLSLYFILKIDRISLFYSGFFVGILWFYWVSFSFRYYDLSYLIPLVILFFALVYALLFLLISIKDNIYLRAILFFALAFFNPFGFNWFKPDILLLDSYFEANKIVLGLIILSTIFLVKKRVLIYTICIIAISFIHINPKPTPLSDIDISLANFYFNQDYKWDRKNLATVVDENFKQINKAIKEHKDVVVLPETTFPFVLNKQEFILQNLLEKSHKITIIAGSLYYKDGEYKNSTYIFKAGNLKIASKVVLVPFGEEIPLPKIFRDFINKIFYNGAKDYTKASAPTDYRIKNISFRNAICYEATSEELYKNLGNTKNIIAISNNAWFTPSIEPSLQKLLLRLYSKIYGVNIYHEINGSENYIITP
ncbi:apolipoprotein N-acyltransferase [Arcobacter nitrofigilis DSM 7299]|uniref:Apolipoprotein N-acyltransferase n=1 Tax=Arcobacter nitrofigilis (strain ATCC 33309 / DSM 7299 / CCUG 15893 / LMG 7604 / NCTC 12251 / CI) TaxID=572480 RepID=D5V282_ARCNC|nr:apolipoprotein N-acyltransferase [Arcobacter nitrofigilis]ADG92315.1 apolipoprotein N-acyltransferase [Arcobacter nitrofigilis DSM 7299]